MNTTSDLGQWPLFDDAMGSADTAPAERSARTRMRRALREARPRVSIVMPCLNEAESIGYSLQDAKAALEHLGIRGEIVVVDNGSDPDTVGWLELLPEFFNVQVVLLGENAWYCWKVLGG